MRNIDNSSTIRLNLPLCLHVDLTCFTHTLFHSEHMTLNEDFNYALLFITIIALFIAIVVLMFP